jgi:hypothetical protein
VLVGRVGSPSDATLAKQNEILAEIDDLRLSGNVTILSPTKEDGSLNDLTVGDSYLNAHDRAIGFGFETSAGLRTQLALSGVTVHLGFLSFGKTRVNPDFLRYEFPGEILTVDEITTVRFELTTEQSRGILPGQYDYDVEFRLDGNFVTSISNPRGKPMRWIESATQLPV